MLRDHLKPSDAWKLCGAVIRTFINQRLINTLLWNQDFNYSKISFLLQAKNEEELWCERSRRRVLRSIMTEWTKLSSKSGTVKNLISALSLPGWFDVKLRVLKLLEENCVTEELQWLMLWTMLWPIVFSRHTNILLRVQQSKSNMTNITFRISDSRAAGESDHCQGSHLLHTWNRGNLD